MDVKLNQTVEITINDETFILTPKEFTKFHDDLTQFINENYEALTKNND